MLTLARRAWQAAGMTTYGLDDTFRALRTRMRRFIDEQVIPAEPALGREDGEAAAAMKRL